MLNIQDWLQNLLSVYDHFLSARRYRVKRWNQYANTNEVTEADLGRFQTPEREHFCENIL